VHDEKKKGVMLAPLWHEYTRHQIDLYGYSRFCEPWAEPRTR
jgi:transposase